MKALEAQLAEANRKAEEAAALLAQSSAVVETPVEPTPTVVSGTLLFHSFFGIYMINMLFVSKKWIDEERRRQKLIVIVDFSHFHRIMVFTRKFKRIR